ncbi:Crp/Fnr family transcriptional regulator [Peribacillus sp. JNUCC 23]
MLKEKKQLDEQLRLLPFFYELYEEQINDLLKYCSLKDKVKNHHLFMQGDPMQSLYFLCRGKIKVYKIDGKGRELIVGIYKEGELFPQDYFFEDHTHYLTNAYVLEDATVLSIPIFYFEQLLEKYPKLYAILFKMVGEQIIDLRSRLEDKIFFTSEEQVINLLLRLARNYAVTLSNQKILFLTSFQIKDLANMIGFSRETVSRIMNKFIMQNLIEKDEKGRLILNPMLIKDFYQ